MSKSSKLSQTATQQISDSLKTIRKRISNAAKNAGRDPDSVQLLAVSKTKPTEALRAAFGCGQRAFGENYLQEAREKQQSLEDLPIEWHFIGPIQSNKTREIAENFDWVHSVDRLKIAKRLSDQRPQHLEAMNICLQVNLDNESSKAGVTLEEIPDLVQKIEDLPRLILRGLMTIPASRDDYDAQLTCFQKLAQAKTPFPKMDTLSMGMSKDMSAAIAAGATIVRVGTGIFGKRHVQ